MSTCPFDPAAFDPAAFDPVAPAFIADPFPVYRQMRDEAPVVFVPHGKGFWFVTRHDLMVQVCNDPDTFSSRVGSLATAAYPPELLAQMTAIAAEGVRNVPTLLTADRPVHTRNRRLVARAFTPRAVAAHADAIRAAARELIAAWDRSGPIEFVRAFAVPLPVRVIAQALAVPDDRIDDFKRWSDAAVALIGSDLPADEVLASMRANNELSHFIIDQIADRRANPGRDDLLSTLVHATLSDDETVDLAADAARQLGDAEIVSIVRQLLVAGNETTTNVLTQSMVLFAEQPEMWQRIRQNPGIADAAAEELIRLWAPSAANRRITTREVELGGITLPAGADVIVVNLAANHDERVFPDPDRFDPERANIREHVGFGRGIHLCIGAPLARLELRIALEELAAAVETVALVDPEHLEWNRSFILRAIKRLPVLIS